MKALGVSVGTARVKAFIWQHLLLLASLFVMTLGVVLCLKSALGSSTISSIPYVMTLAGDIGKVPALSVGNYTILMNFLFVGLQVIVLRRRFEPVQLFQLAVGFLFGWFIDLNMWILSWLDCTALTSQAFCQLLGCTVLGLGIAFEVKCGSVTMPGEGISMSLSLVTGKPFAKVKIFVDSTLVVIAVALGYLFFGKWMGQVIGVGTLFAMVYVGLVVKFVTPRIKWFDSIVATPGFRRYLFGIIRRFRS